MISWSRGSSFHAVSNMQHQGFVSITKDMYNTGSNGNEIWSRSSVKSQHMSVKLSRAYDVVFMKALFWLYVGLLRTSSTGLIKTLLLLSYFHEILKQNLNCYSELIWIHGCSGFAMCSWSQTCHLVGTQPKAEIEKRVWWILLLIQNRPQSWGYQLF